MQTSLYDAWLTVNCQQIISMASATTAVISPWPVVVTMWLLSLWSVAVIEASASGIGLLLALLL